MAGGGGIKQRRQMQYWGTICTGISALISCYYCHLLHFLLLLLLLLLFVIVIVVVAVCCSIEIKN